MADVEVDVDVASGQPKRRKFSCRLTPRLAMAARDYSYEATLNCLSSLVTPRIGTDVSNKGDYLNVMFDYLKILDLEKEVQKLKVVHVAGTKGKGSTCTFTESIMRNCGFHTWLLTSPILRNCGFHTWLFTSPHLIVVRERFRLDGVEISEEKFLEYFWWCWDRFQERTGGDVPMLIYFRFLTLLAFKIFTAEKLTDTAQRIKEVDRATSMVEEILKQGASQLNSAHDSDNIILLG